MANDLTSWAELLETAREDAEDNSPLAARSRTDEEMAVQFDPGYGGTNGLPFTAWTEDRVYFPICYDGEEWVGSAPRNPGDRPEHCVHQGG